MKALNAVKKYALTGALAVCLVLILLGVLPELPSSKPIAPGNAGAEMRSYMLENLFPIVFFIASVLIGGLFYLFGLSLRRSLDSDRQDSGMIVTLSIFILVSGLWVLTDSKALSIYTIDYGGTMDKSAIVFISYICLMLLPIIFISFLQYVIHINRFLWILDGLLILNLSVFALSSALRLPRACYLTSLLIHHALIYLMMIVGTAYCLKKLRGTSDMQKKYLTRGILLLMFFSGISLAAFLLGAPHLYAILFGTGMVILIQYMFRLTLYRVMTAHNESIKSALYKSLAYKDILTDIKNRNAFIQEQYRDFSIFYMRTKDTADLSPVRINIQIIDRSQRAWRDSVGLVRSAIGLCPCFAGCLNTRFVAFGVGIIGMNAMNMVWMESRPVQWLSFRQRS